MKYIAKYAVFLFLSSLTFNVFSEQKYCMVFAKDFSDAEKVLTEKCAVGDVIYYTDGGIYPNISARVSAIGCDFSKSIISDRSGDLACVYNGIAGYRKK